MFGVLNINKHANVTSRAVVNEVCRIFGTRKVGHAGTLDPLATGVLVVCIGPATRLISFIQEMRKVYVGKFQFGFESSTEDRFGDMTPYPDSQVVTESQLRELLPRFTGAIEQVPPQFSALKIDGKRAYALARRGKQVALAPRKVTIESLRLLALDFPEFELEISCGSGTYVRSLGRDIGRAAKSGAHMTDLQRTAIGDFQIANGVALEHLERSSLLNPIACLSGIAQTTLSNSQIMELANGTMIPIDEAEPKQRHYAAMSEDGRLIALMEKMRFGVYKPKINFVNYWKSQESGA